MILDWQPDIAAEAAKRWQSRAGIREPNRTKVDEGRVAEAETPQRIQWRLQRLARAATQEKAAHAVQGEAAKLPLPSPRLVETVGLERVMGTPDFLGINFIELALAVARFVGRVNIRLSPGRTAGFGTGFMVSPRLFMTNNHVLGNPKDALYSEVEFDYQYDRNGRLLPVVNFGLEPETFFLTSKELDYTLVAVKDMSVSGIEVKRYGWSRLVGSQGKALLGESLNIIQHPKGEAKQVVLRHNELVDLFDHFAHYVTDTEPGSSGSPVYNDQWEVVALHHSGVPKTDANGNYLSKDGSVWRNGMDPDDLAWVANEGIRVSSLVDHISRQPLTPAQRPLLDDMLNLEPANPIEAARMAADAAAAMPVHTARQPASAHQDAEVSAKGSGPDGSVTWTIPLEVTVRVGTPLMSNLPVLSQTSSQAGATPPSPGSAGAEPSAVTTTDVTASSPALREALAEFEAAATRVYYDEAADRRARQTYYQGIADDVQRLSGEELYTRLSEHLKKTHKTPLRYQPAQHVYPWVDLHEASPRPVLKSIYSGQTADPRSFIEEDFRIEAQRARLQELLVQEAAGIGAQEQLDILEASLPLNCEHVVPQSWFGKREPMRGDLHHLFACEPGCNSFRSNVPYFDFPDFEETVRDACGKREEGRFEPASGKGAVARATLYFLLRYPREINRTSREYTEERISALLDWHQRFPVTRYEKHRNAAIFEKQGNRNPLIDFPEWASQIDFLRGLG